MAFVYLSLLSNFLGTLKLKCVLVWLPELSAVIQRSESIKGGQKIFFPIYSTASTLLQSSQISQSLPEDTIWRLAPAKKKMQGLC